MRVPAYRRYVLVNIGVVLCYFLFWALSLFVLRFPTWVNIGAALVTLAVMTMLYMMQQRRG